MFVRRIGRIANRWTVSAAAIALVSFVAASFLLPEVALSQPPVPGYPQTADEATASRVLGQPLPRPSAVVPDFARTELTIIPADPNLAAARAMVNQTFGIRGTNVALLTVFKGTLKLDIPGAIDGTIDLSGSTAGFTVRQLPDGSTSVGYKWTRHGLVYNLHIGLIQGIDRPTADRIAASIP